jgi:hypothetical protein
LVLSINKNTFAAEMGHILAGTPLIGLFCINIGPNKINKDTPLLDIFK